MLLQCCSSGIRYGIWHAES